MKPLDVVVNKQVFKLKQRTTNPTYGIKSSKLAAASKLNFAGIQAETTEQQ